jgi:hypothetical protein
MAKTAGGDSVRYGRVNTEMIGRWLRLAPEDDGPFWALNLMKYRDVADYGDGETSARSGREADDEYTPLGPLAAVGAQVVFAAEVERIDAGDGVAWDRIGIVRYPSRRKFFEMQQREDFKSKHVHKDAGMEFTIVMSCLPVLPFEGAAGRHPYVELRVGAGAETAGADGSVFDVEGVIVGDERAWGRASFRWLDRDDEAVPEAKDEAPSYVLLLRPTVDWLTRSVREA